jgi:hypothetical protein
MHSSQVDKPPTSPMVLPAKQWRVVAANAAANLRPPSVGSPKFSLPGGVVPTAKEAVAIAANRARSNAEFDAKCAQDLKANRERDNSVLIENPIASDSDFPPLSHFRGKSVCNQTPCSIMPGESMRPSKTGQSAGPVGWEWLTEPAIVFGVDDPTPLPASVVKFNRELSVFKAECEKRKEKLRSDRKKFDERFKKIVAERFPVAAPSPNFYHPKDTRATHRQGPSTSAQQTNPLIDVKPKTTSVKPKVTLAKPKVISVMPKLTSEQAESARLKANGTRPRWRF